MQINIALIQQNVVWRNVSENLKICSNLIATCSNKPDLIILPEMFATGFITEPEIIKKGDQELVFNWMKETARESNAAIMGSISYNEGDKYFNRLFSVKPDGAEQHYDKRHLFSIGGEQKRYSPGVRKTIVEWKGWNFLPLICYDLRFPVWSRNSGGYDVMIVVANWPAERSKVWEILLRARAIENQAYVIGVNRVGTDGRNIKYIGQSMLVSPEGEIMAALGNEQKVLEFQLLKENLDAYRVKFPVFPDADAFELK